MSDHYILVNGEETGPFELEELHAMIRQGEIRAETLYARPGMYAWEPLSKTMSNEAPAQVVWDAGMGGYVKNAEAEVGISAAYEDGGFEVLMRGFGRLSTYAEVNEWDALATEEIGKIVRALRGLDQEIGRESRALEQARMEFQQRSFLKRTFGGHDGEDRSAVRLAGLRQRKARLLQMVAELQEAVDFTPNTREEKEVLAKELRLRKKELQARKKEATAAMAEIRKEARVQSVHAGKNWIGLYDSELAADQRRGIRYAKEAALRPHEDAKAAFERQLIKVEKDLLWVERFEV